MEQNSVTSTLEDIINKVEFELEQEEKIIRTATKRKHDDIPMSNIKRSKLEPHKSSSEEEIHCRICYDDSQQSPIIYPCKCKGTMGAIHVKCLERWLEESNRKSCELCGTEFTVERTLRHKAIPSIIIWLCLTQEQHQLYVHNTRADLLRFLIVTPVTIVCSYICIVAADFYAMNNYNNFPPARWTTYSLLIMMILVIFSYFIWMYMAIQYHQKVWFYWWQKTNIVRIILPQQNTTFENSDITLC